MLLSGSLNATLVIAELNKKDIDLIFANSALLLACLSWMQPKHDKNKGEHDKKFVIFLLRSAIFSE